MKVVNLSQSFLSCSFDVLGTSCQSFKTQFWSVSFYGGYYIHGVWLVSYVWALEYRTEFYMQQPCLGLR